MYEKKASNVGKEGLLIAHKLRIEHKIIVPQMIFHDRYKRLVLVLAFTGYGRGIQPAWSW